VLLLSLCARPRHSLCVYWLQGRHRPLLWPWRMCISSRGHLLRPFLSLQEQSTGSLQRSCTRRKSCVLLLRIQAAGGSSSRWLPQCFCAPCTAGCTTAPCTALHTMLHHSTMHGTAHHVAPQHHARHCTPCCTTAPCARHRTAQDAALPPRSVLWAPPEGPFLCVLVNP